MLDIVNYKSELHSGETFTNAVAYPIDKRSDLSFVRLNGENILFPSGTKHKQVYLYAKYVMYGNQSSSTIDFQIQREWGWYRHEITDLWLPEFYKLIEVPGPYRDTFTSEQWKIILGEGAKVREEKTRIRKVLLRDTTLSLEDIKSTKRALHRKYSLRARALNATRWVNYADLEFSTRLEIEKVPVGPKRKVLQEQKIKELRKEMAKLEASGEEGQKQVVLRLERW